MKLPFLLLGDEAKMMVPMVGWTEVTHMLETWRIQVKVPITDMFNKCGHYRIQVEQVNMKRVRDCRRTSPKGDVFISPRPLKAQRSLQKRGGWKESEAVADHKVTVLCGHNMAVTHMSS